MTGDVPAISGAVSNISGLPGEMKIAGAIVSVSVAVASVTVAVQEAVGGIVRIPNSGKDFERDATAMADDIGFGIASGLCCPNLASEFCRRNLAGHGEFPDCRVSEWANDHRADFVHAREA